MSLDYRVTTVPEGLEEHYKQDGDNGFVLEVAGVVDETSYNTLKAESEESKAKVKEFRDNNIKLKEQIEGFNHQSAPEGDASADVQAKIDAAVSGMRERLDKFENENQTLTHQLEEVVLSDRVKDIAVRNGVHESALPDVVTRARSVFTVKDGKPVPKDSVGRDEQGNVLTPESWFKKLETDAPHLFKPSTGTGARRSASGRFVEGDQKVTPMDRIRSGLSNHNGDKTKQIM